MTKYLVLHNEDGSINTVRICYTTEQLETYSKLYAEQGEKFTIESKMPSLTAMLMKADEWNIRLFERNLVLAQKFISEKGLTVEFMEWKKKEAKI